MIRITIEREFFAEKYIAFWEISHVFNLAESSVFSARKVAAAELIPLIRLVIC